MPTALGESLFIRGEPIHTGGILRLRPLQKTRGAGTAHHGRHRGHGDGEDRQDNRKGEERPSGRCGEGDRAASLAEDKAQERHGTPHGSGNHCRGRHAGCHEPALRHSGGDRLLSGGTQDACPRRLPFVSGDGKGARSLRGVRLREGEEQSVHQPHP